MLKLYGLSTLDPQQWEEPAVDTDAQDDALGLALSVTQTPMMGHEEAGDGAGMVRREMEDPLGLKPRLEM